VDSTTRPGDPNPAVAVRTQLEHILASELFAGSARLSRLLRFVVERTLDGRGDEIKEYVLGTEVFDRGADYDPRLDSIVRVEARRLRGKLDEYYARPDARREAIIRMRRGSYVPAFDVPSPSADARQPAAAAPARVAPELLPEASALAGPGGTRRPVFVATAIALVAVTALALQIVRSPTPVQADALPRLAVLPFGHFPADADTSSLAERLTDGITTELVRAGGIEVVSRTSARQYVEGPRSARDIGAALDAAWLIEAVVHRESTGLRLEARLVETARDRKVWVDEFLAPAAGVRDLQRRAAIAIAAAVHTATTRQQ
jgi:TolB-like protein